MKPIPLAAPDGTVALYLCGICAHPGGVGGSLMVRAEPGWQAAESLAEAEACCKCRDCGRPFTAEEGRAFECDDCRAKTRVRYAEIEARHQEARDAEPKLPDEPRAQRLASLLEGWGVDRDDVDAAGLQILAMLENFPAGAN